MRAYLASLILGSFLFMTGAVAQSNATLNAPQVMSDQELKNSSEAAETWLKVVDEGNYDKSWDTGSLTFQLTIPKKEWSKALQSMRQPLGNVVSRQLVEQRPAENPKGLPKGFYMVLFYKTSFSNRQDASELLTLQQQNNGQWKVLTYHVR